MSEAVADLLAAARPADRLLGRRTRRRRGRRAGWNFLFSGQRALPGFFPGRSVVAIEDIGRLRDGVGVAGAGRRSASFPRPRRSARGLLGRCARTHSPFTTAESAAGSGSGCASPPTCWAGVRRRATGPWASPPRATGDQCVDATCCGSCGSDLCAALRAQVRAGQQHHRLRAFPACMAWLWGAGHGSGPPTSGMDGLAAVIDHSAASHYRLRRSNRCVAPRVPTTPPACSTNYWPPAR